MRWTATALVVAVLLVAPMVALVGFTALPASMLILLLGSWLDNKPEERL